MNQIAFENVLDRVCEQLTAASRKVIFENAAAFEQQVRQLLHDALSGETAFVIDFTPHPQAFPDIAVGSFGVEVKFTLTDTWRSIGNSVLESNRIEAVEKIYLVFGKMGGLAEVRWGHYEKSVVHVRTSHVPRFEVELFAEKSLFQSMGVDYDRFRELPMEEKMQHIRTYARARLKRGERLWWLEDEKDEAHALPIQARLYTSLSTDEKNRLRAQAALLCPGIVASGRSKHKYDDVVLFLLTYHGVLCHQARDLYTAGSVANPQNDNEGGVYIERSLKLIQAEMVDASLNMEDALFVEYWGESVAPVLRIRRWLDKADLLAKGWTPSQSLFGGTLR